MKIITKEKLKNFKDEVLKDGNEDLTVGKAISNILITAEEGGKMKMYSLAQKFYSDKEVDVDSADLALIKGAIEKTKAYVNLVTGQLLVLLEKVK